MARKSPRSRRKPSSPNRLPDRERPRAAPGRGRKRASSRRAASPGKRTAHGTRGAHGTAAADGTRGAKTAKPARGGSGAASRRRVAKPARRFSPPDPSRVAAILDGLDRLYPDARCELDFGSPLQLLIATILSAQCTDQRVNMVTPALFERFPDAAAFANSSPEELEEIIRSTGFYRNKAKSIRACCADIVKLHGGEVPRTLEQLVALAGVGRKTANVVLGNAYGIPGLVVDTHVTRLSNRLGLVDGQDAVKIEFALMPVVPKERWTIFSHWLILHGRRVCNARKPFCSKCPIAEHCPRIGVTVSQ